MHAYYHSVSSVKKWGGEPEDYLDVHLAIDESRLHVPDLRHRALYHHSAGIEAMIKRFGPYVKIKKGRVLVPTSHICEMHITEDIGFVPSLQDWMDCIARPRWGSPKAKLLFSSFEEKAESQECLADS